MAHNELPKHCGFPNEIYGTLGFQSKLVAGVVVFQLKQYESHSLQPVICMEQPLMPIPLTALTHFIATARTRHLFVHQLKIRGKT